MIQPGWVLTAAHCVGGGSAVDYQVRLGTTQRTGDDDASLQTIQVQQIFQHTVGYRFFVLLFYLAIYMLDANFKARFLMSGNGSGLDLVS